MSILVEKAREDRALIEAGSLLPIPIADASDVLEGSDVVEADPELMPPEGERVMPPEGEPLDAVPACPVLPTGTPQPHREKLGS